MRRAERLFRIVQFLRHQKKAVTAQAIANEVEVSPRTIYRDIAHLVGSGVPLDGEAGVGYVLRDDYELPPLTFTFEQIEALAFGARAAAMLADPQLALAAKEALAKLEAALPAENAALLRAAPIFSFRPQESAAPPALLAKLRKFIRARQKIRIHYRSIKDDESVRIVRPLALINFGPVWLLTAWCELRKDFRSFRVDLIEQCAATGDIFEDEPGKTLDDYRDMRTAMRQAPDTPPSKHC